MNKATTMIDTVILTIQGGNTKKINDDHIPRWSLHSRDKAYSKHIQKLSREQKNDGVYRPKTAWIVRGKSMVLRIEFSVPKLLYGNNVDEVHDGDFETVVGILSKRLAEQGVIVSNQTIREASVSGFHPSKNIILSGGYTVSSVLKVLEKVNLTKKMDLTKQTFYNGGESLQYWSKTHSFVMYDKKRDYCKPKSRATDKDRGPDTMSIFDDFHLLPEILKMEVRLTQKRKLNEIMVSVGSKKDPSFEDIFKSKICQKIINLYWDTLVYDNNYFLFHSTSGPQNFLRQILKNTTGIKQKRALYLVGLIQTVEDDGGIMGLRKMLKISNRAWYRIVDDFRKLDFLEDEGLEWVLDIKTQLSKFEPVKLAKLRVKQCKV